MGAERRRRGIIVTGASGVIGGAIARAFGAEGAFVGVGYRTSRPAAEATLEAVRAAGADGILLEAELGSSDDCERLLQQFLGACPQLDVLVNNAGISRDDLIFYMQRADWDSVLRSNLDTLFELTRRAVKHMIPLRGGRIINVSSASGRVGVAGQTHYAAAKAGIEGFTRALARELGRFGILVNAVAPGAIESPSVERLGEKQRERLVEGTCLRRLGTADEVARVVRFLASGDASYITGQVVAVDGGVSA